MSGLGQLAPRWLRRAVGRGRGEIARAHVLAELQRVARSGRPVIVGPWLGEVGFEILYWVPFLRWVRDVFDLTPERLIAVSRGGPVSWYRDIATRYIDVFDVMSVEALRRGNDERRRATGEQKQLHASAFDEAILAAASTMAKAVDAVTLHPAVLYRLLRPYWWHHASVGWVERHARYERFTAPPLPAALGLTPRQYVAVKFYTNDCLPPSSVAHRWVHEMLSRLAAEHPVVSLTTAVALDDHADAVSMLPAGVRTLAGHVTSRNNLEVQTAVVANARAFVGTYGGFSYLAPLCGVPGHAAYVDGDAFDRSHLRLAQHVSRRLGIAFGEPLDLTRTPVDVVLAAVRSHA